MILYPTLELLNGRCVSLEGGRLEEASIWHVDPVETARSWVADGAEWMHVTDFNWVQGREGNDHLIQQIIRSVGIPVQLAGGFRSAEGVAHWIDRGAARIVLSTLAVRDPQTVKSLARRFPDQIVLSVDVLNGRVMTDGWRRESAFAPEDLICAFADAPLAGVIVTDIESDRAGAEAQMGLISGLAPLAKAPVIASGVIRTADDVARLAYIPNIAGALVGRALFRKTVSLKDALRMARPDATPVAEFL